MVEIRDTHAFVHGANLKGAGGLPVGSSGKALLLLSGGIDSPVAGYRMARRGVHISAIHYVSPPYTSDRAQEFAQFMAESATVQGEMVAEYDKHSLQSEISTGEDTTGAMQHELDKKAEEDEMTGVRSSVEKIVQLLNPANLATLVLHAIAALLVGIIQVIILGIGVVIVKILVILGPFVFAVSMLPVFQKQLSVWFGTLCSSCMVFTVINILNQIIWQTFKHIYTESADIVDAATQQIQYLGMDLALLGAYCSCFWLSSKIVGHSDAGKIISKAVSIVTTAATIALMGSAAAGSKLTNVGGAASIGESIINDNSKK